MNSPAPSTPTCLIRLARIHDAEAVREIYAPSVRDGVASFELDVPTAEEMGARIQHIVTRYPWLVLERNGGVLGYAYAGPHRERAAYRWCVETAIYVAADAHGSGIGRRLYDALFPILTRQGFVNAYAGITLPNPASVALHERCGFAPVGVYRRIGFKFGAWHDVGWWSRSLLQAGNEPAEPIPLADLDPPAFPE